MDLHSKLKRLVSFINIVVFCFILFVPNLYFENMHVIDLEIV